MNQLMIGSQAASGSQKSIVQGQQMRNVTLISTYHEEKGLCNVTELHRLLESIQPEVIFLETPPSRFEKYSNEMDSWNLESKAVSRYLMTHGATKLVPVDVAIDDLDDLIAEDKNLHERVKFVSPDYGRLMYSNSQRTEIYGLEYLNSRYSIEYWLKLDEVIKAVVESIREERLFRAYQRWKEVIEFRDSAMLENIQKYIEANEFNSGVFLVGAAHRSSILEKSKRYAFKLSEYPHFHAP